MLTMKITEDSLAQIVSMMNSKEYEIVSAEFDARNMSLDVIYYNKNDGKKNSTFTAKLGFEYI